MRKRIPSICFSFLLFISFQAIAHDPQTLNREEAIRHNDKHYSLAEKFLSIDEKKSLDNLWQIDHNHPEFEDSLIRLYMNQKLDLLPQLRSPEAVIQAMDTFLFVLKEKNDRIGLAEMHERKVDYLMSISDFTNGHPAVMNAISFFESNNNEDKIGEMLLKKGAIEYAKGDYIRSIETVFDAADRFKESGSKYHLAFSYLQIGITYLYINQFDRSIHNYEMARDEFLNFQDTLGAAVCNSNIALVYLEQGHYDTALVQFLSSLKVLEKSDRKIAVSQALHNIGLCYAGLNRPDSALNYMQKSLRIDQDIQYHIGISSNFLQIAQVFESLEEKDSSLIYGAMALEELKKSPDIDIESEASLMMGMLHFEKQEYEKSAVFFQQYVSLQDSIDRESELLDKIAQDHGGKLEKYRNELVIAKEKEKIIEKENKNQKNLIFGMALIGALLILVLVQLLVINRRNKNLNRTLSKNQKIIENDLSIKKSLLNEIHHRVKNNLQVISSMLSIQTQYITDPKLTSIMEESKARINSMALIHESLYKRDTNDVTSFSSYIKNLIPRLVNTYQVDEQKVHLSMDLEEIELSIDESVPCGLLLNELVSNSLKHAFPNDQKGEIKVSMKTIGEEIQFRIEDNGAGLPADVVPDNQDSFGFLLIYTLADQLEAKMNVETQNGLAFTFQWKPKDYTMLT